MREDDVSTCRYSRRIVGETPGAVTLDNVRGCHSCFDPRTQSKKRRTPGVARNDEHTTRTPPRSKRRYDTRHCQPCAIRMFPDMRPVFVVEQRTIRARHDESSTMGPTI